MSWWNGKSESQERGEKLQEIHNKGQEDGPGGVEPNGFIVRALTGIIGGPKDVEPLDEENEAYRKGQENAQD